MGDINGLIAQAIRDVCRAMPWLTEAALRATWVPNDRVATASVDKRLRVFINPAFFEQLNGRERAGVVAHELLHVVLRHPHRFPAVTSQVNLVTDAEVNAAIRRVQALALPEGAIYPATIGASDAETAEEMLSHLSHTEMRSIDDHGYPDWGVGAWSQADDLPSGLDPQEVEKIARACYIRAAHGQYGSAPGCIEREYQRTRYYIPWHRLLAGAVRGACAGRVTGWAIRRPHPCVAPDIGLPMLARLRSARIALICDTSGSMSPEDLGLMAQAMEEMHRYGEVWAIICDAAVYAVRQLRPGERPSFQGGGGTDLRPAFAAAQELAPSVIIVITDTYGDWPCEPPSCPVWVVATAEDTLPGMPDWARVIRPARKEGL